MKPEHIKAMDALVSEFAHLNVLSGALSSRMVEILQRHPDKTRLAVRGPRGGMFFYEVMRGDARYELVKGCGCTYATSAYERGEEPTEEHSDGRLLHDLQDAHAELAARTAEATKKLADLLIAIGVG